MNWDFIFFFFCIIRMREKFFGNCVNSVLFYGSLWKNSSTLDSKLSIWVPLDRTGLQGIRCLGVVLIDLQCIVSKRYDHIVATFVEVCLPHHQRVHCTSSKEDRCIHPWLLIHLSCSSWLVCLLLFFFKMMYSPQSISLNQEKKYVRYQIQDKFVLMIKVNIRHKFLEKIENQNY